MDREGTASGGGLIKSQSEEEDLEAGCYSPKYILQSELEPGNITLQEEDAQRLEFARNQVVNTGRKVQSASAEEQAIRKHMDVDEGHEFNVELSLEVKYTYGLTNVGLESHATSTAFTQAMSGINTIKPTMIWTIHVQR